MQYSLKKSCMIPIPCFYLSRKSDVGEIGGNKIALTTVTFTAGLMPASRPAEQNHATHCKSTLRLAAQLSHENSYR